MASLTPKQEAFARHYIETGNASEAYRRAYDVGPKTKADTVHDTASKLLQHPQIAHRITELQQAVARRHDVTVDRIVRELALLGFANMLDYVRTTDQGDAYVDLSDLTREQAAAISEIIVEEYREGGGEAARDVKRTRFKLTDKRAALESLGKHLGMFKDIRELTGKNGGPIKTETTVKLDPASAAQVRKFLG